LWVSKAVPCDLGDRSARLCRPSPTATHRQLGELKGGTASRCTRTPLPTRGKPACRGWVAEKLVAFLNKQPRDAHRALATELSRASTFPATWGNSQSPRGVGEILERRRSNSRPDVRRFTRPCSQAVPHSSNRSTACERSRTDQTWEQQSCQNSYSPPSGISPIRQ
jgi:hypothetical protein